MNQPGQIFLFRFPQTDLEEGRLRPALLLGKLPGEYDDWLICMISTQLWHCVEGFDEVVHKDDPEFGRDWSKNAQLDSCGTPGSSNGKHHPWDDRSSGTRET